MDDRMTQRILNVFGVAVAIIGAICVWKALTEILPAGLGWYGVLWTAGAFGFTILGILFIVLPGPLIRRKARKEAERLARETEAE